MRWRRRREPMPDDVLPAWQAFLDCAQVIEGGRRTLLGTMPVGRVEHTPVGFGVDAMAAALDDAEAWMDDWRVEPLEDAWQDCAQAMDEAREHLDEVRTVAADTDELEELQEAVSEVIEPLDAFADAERSWRRTWKVPRDR